MDESLSETVPLNEHDSKVIWEREKVYKLIELVEARPELWDCSLKAYKNRNLKNKIHESIAQTLNLTANLVAKKIHNLRCQLNTELRKIKSKKCGAGTNEIYSPKWEYFESVKFMSLSAKECVPSVDSHSPADNVVSK